MNQMIVGHVCSIASVLAYCVLYAALVVQVADWHRLAMSYSHCKVYEDTQECFAMLLTKVHITV